MSRILYSWELGSGFGHVGSFLPLARLLRARGHQIQWVLAQTAPTARLLAAEGVTGIQAPCFPEARHPGPPLTYNDILLRFGYARADDLLGLVGAWRDLMRSTNTQLVLADHSPTAILAARTLSIPVMLFSNSFCVPPRQRPLPGMRPWQPLQAGQAEASEHQALASINAVLLRLRCPLLDAVEQLFDVAEDTLLGFPEIDNYAERGAARYWGNLADAGVSTAPSWPNVSGKRIFAYLRAESRHHEAALDALQALGQPAIVFFPDAPPSLLERHSAPHIVMSTVPLNLVQAAREADAAITYGSLNTTTCFLLAGKPVLMLPSDLEKYLIARCVEEMGAGLLAHPEQPATDLKAKLKDVLDEPGYASNARAFARKYAPISAASVTANLIRRIEEITLDGISGCSASAPPA